MSRFKKTNLILPKDYLSQSAPLDKEEIFLQRVKREDEIRHAHDPRLPIPKVIIKSTPKVGLAFFKEILV